MRWKGFERGRGGVTSKGEGYFGKGTDDDDDDTGDGEGEVGEVDDDTKRLRYPECIKLKLQLVTKSKYLRFGC